jgi:hypothetical protein
MKMKLQSNLGLGWFANIETENGFGSIGSNLALCLSEGEEDQDAENELKASGHALDSMILALACEGLLLHPEDQARVVRSIDNAVESILNNFD